MCRNVTTAPAKGARSSQADRRARSRNALLESAARGLSRFGYANLVLEDVARDAGYTRGALYHQFASKEELALAVVQWVGETWYEQMGPLFANEDDPVGALVAVARGHAVYCRRDIARSMMSLRVEFAGQDHPVAKLVTAAGNRIVADCARLVTAGRKNGSIPPGPPPRIVAAAVMGALEGLVIILAGKAPHDEDLAEQLARGLLGLPQQTGTTSNA